MLQGFLIPDQSSIDYPSCKEVPGYVRIHVKLAGQICSPMNIGGYQGCQVFQIADMDLKGGLFPYLRLDPR